jgi:hypothetical protein
LQAVKAMSTLFHKTGTMDFFPGSSMPKTTSNVMDCA